MPATNPPTCAKKAVPPCGNMRARDGAQAAEQLNDEPVSQHDRRRNFDGRDEDEDEDQREDARRAET